MPYIAPEVVKEVKRMDMFATILIEQGVSLAKISGLLGHSSVNTTFEYYCDVMDENEKIMQIPAHLTTHSAKS